MAIIVVQCSSCGEAFWETGIKLTIQECIRTGMGNDPVDFKAVDHCECCPDMDLFSDEYRRIQPMDILA